MARPDQVAAVEPFYESIRASPCEIPESITRSVLVKPVGSTLRETTIFPRSRLSTALGEFGRGVAAIRIKPAMPGRPGRDRRQLPPVQFDAAPYHRRRRALSGRHDKRGPRAASASKIPLSPITTTRSPSATSDAAACPDVPTSPGTQAMRTLRSAFTWAPTSGPDLFVRKQPAVRRCCRPRAAGLSCSRAEYSL